MDSVERAQGRRRHAPGETEGLLGKEPLGGSCQRSVESVVNLVVSAPTTVEPSPQGSPDLDPGRGRQDGHGNRSDVTVKCCLHSVGLGFLH